MQKSNRPSRQWTKMTQQEADEKNTAENREDSIRREYGFAPDVKLKECRFCCVMIPKKAKVCPNCRMSLKRHWFRCLLHPSAPLHGLHSLYLFRFQTLPYPLYLPSAPLYYLSEHWGIMKDAVASVWRAQNGSAVPVTAFPANASVWFPVFAVFTAFAVFDS
mgnify:CR=1 FL=1